MSEQHSQTQTSSNRGGNPASDRNLGEPEQPQRMPSGGWSLDSDGDPDAQPLRVASPNPPQSPQADGDPRELDAPQKEDFDNSHRSTDKKPLPKRSGDMDRPGMEPDTDAEA